MISIFDTNGTTRLGITFNSASLNTITKSSAGARSSEYGISTEVVGYRTAFDYISEPNQWADLMELYGLRKSSRIVTLRGFVRGSSKADLMDRVKNLAAATDPSRIKFQNPTNFFLPLTFSTLTTDSSNFPSGYASCCYYGIPVRMVEPPISSAGMGLSAKWEGAFLLRDPKRFLNQDTTITGAASSTNLGDDRSFPTLTFTLSGGAGSASFTVSNTGTYQGTLSLVLNLSGYSSGSWSVNFKDRTITQDGVLKYDVYKSGDWFMMEPGVNTIAYSNTTNTSSRVITYRMAWTL